MRLGFDEGDEIAPPGSGAVPALTPHFPLAARPPVPPSLHGLGTFPAASGSQAGRGGQRGVSGDGIGVSAGLGQGCWQRARARPSGPQPAPPTPQRPPCGCGGNGRAGGCPWHGAAPWLSGTRLLFLISFAFSSVPNELGQGESGLVSEELVLGRARAVQGWPIPGPALRRHAGTGRSRARGVGAGGPLAEVPQEGMSCRQTKREKSGVEWHA